MPIKPQIINNVIKHADPSGCKKEIEKQILRVQNVSHHKNKPLRALILGCSSGIGLAARIALTFGAANANTIGVSLDSQPTPHSEANAGHYNNQWFKHLAEKEGHTAINIQGDVFSPQTKIDVIEAIETYFEGEVDLIIYSIASNKRRKPTNNNDFWKAVIKPMNEPLRTNHINIDDDSLSEIEIPPATNEEILATKKVMGGEDWAAWVETLINSESIAEGCQTYAFSYIGPELTNPIYLDGTLGHAKIDLHQTSHALNLELANFGGSAHAVVCKALVTRASIVIPGLLPYLVCLDEVLEEHNNNQDALDQMLTLFYDKVSDPQNIETDSERLIRLDEMEITPETQNAVANKLKALTPETIASNTSYQSIKKQFLQLNGYKCDI